MPKESSPHLLDEKGKQAFDEGDYLSAAHVFGEAAEVYSARNDKLMAAEMKSNQCVALLRAKKADQALEAIKGVATVFEVNGDIRRQGMALGNQAAALDALKRKREAIDCYEQAAALLEKDGADELRWKVMRMVTLLHFSRFKFLDAVLALQSGLMGIKKPNWKQRIMKALLFMRL